MRLPNGAKREPQSGLFLSAKILRIHCKKQGSGRIDPTVLCTSKLVFCFFVKKTAFSKPTISPLREHHFWGFKPHMFMFFSCFFNTFFEVQFFTSNMTMLSFTCKLHIFRAGFHANSSWKNMKNHQKLLLKTSHPKNVFFYCHFHECAPRLHKNSISGGFFKDKLQEFCVFLRLS